MVINYTARVRLSEAPREPLGMLELDQAPGFSFHPSSLHEILILQIKIPPTQEPALS